MRTVTLEELQQNYDDYMAEVTEGEMMIITVDNNDVAVLMPIETYECIVD